MGYGGIRHGSGVEVAWSACDRCGAMSPGWEHECPIQRLCCCPLMVGRGAGSIVVDFGARMERPERMCEA